MAYLPPGGGRMNVTIGGNTAGVGSLISTGTMALAGGNNITLSQNGANGLTIIGGAAGGLNTFGMSNLGNTSGTSGVISGSALQYALAGGNNITLSQSINGSAATLTISAPNQSAQTANLYASGNSTQLSSTAGVDVRSLSFQGAGIASVGVSQGKVLISVPSGGGAAGVAFANSETTYTSGTVNLVGDGQVTVYSAANQSYRVSIPGTSSLSATGALNISSNGGTISIGVPAFSAGISTNGNTAGTSGTISNQLILAGGNNITLSQSTGTGGNTVSVIAGGGGVALYASNASFTSGTVSLSNAGGALTIGTAAQQINLSVPATSSLSGVNGISVAANGNTISISQMDETNDFYQNMDRGTTALLGTANGTLMLQRLNQENQRFGADITANTMMLNMSGSLTATASSSAHTFSVSVAIYSDLITGLNLINSASTSWALAANTSISAAYNGARWISFVSSQWSSAPVFQQGGEYVFGILARSSGLAVPMSYIGQNYMNSVQRSGYIGASIATNTSLAQGNYWNAMYSASTTALPASISASQVNRNNATAIFMPHVILNNRYSGTF